ncbi:unnamed protein product [Choristocarpus tenellus]
MRTSFSVAVVAGTLVCSSCVHGFVVSPGLGARALSPVPKRTSGVEVVGNIVVGPLRAGEEGERGDQEPMDLDLEQMFEVFEAADKEIPDGEVGKKGEKKGKDAKDPGDIMGDLMANIFGGGEKK